MVYVHIYIYREREGERGRERENTVCLRYSSLRVNKHSIQFSVFYKAFVGILCEAEKMCACLYKFINV